MKDCRTSLFIAVLFASLVMFSIPNASAATPSFTITATNVTMSSNGSSGSGSSTFTLTSVNGYAGQVLVNCNAPTIPAGVKVPYCNVPLPPHTYSLAANQVVTGNLSLYNSPVPVAPASLRHRKGHGLVSGLALAGVLLFGFGFRRRAARWVTLTLLALCAFFTLASISACGANNSYVTPGNYAYTISATDVSTAVSVTTSINVTVP